MTPSIFQSYLQNLSGPSYPLDARTQPLFMAPGPAQGLATPGNINLKQLPVIKNPDGSYSTVNSQSFYDDKVGSPTYGKEVLVRGIMNGKRVEDQFKDDKAGTAALKQQYYRDGLHLGAFSDGDAADAYATRLHEDWMNGKIPGVAMLPGDPAAGLTNPQ